MADHDIWTNFRSTIAWILLMKFGHILPKGFRELVWSCVQTISEKVTKMTPLSLWCRAVCGLGHYLKPVSIYKVFTKIPSVVLFTIFSDVCRFSYSLQYCWDMCDLKVTIWTNLNWAGSLMLPANFHPNMISSSGRKNFCLKSVIIQIGYAVLGIFYGWRIATIENIFVPRLHGCSI